MTYIRLKKHEGIRLFKDMVFSKIALDLLHNSSSKGRRIGSLYQDKERKS